MTTTDNDHECRVDEFEDTLPENGDLKLEDVIKLPLGNEKVGDRCYGNLWFHMYVV